MPFTAGIGENTDNMEERLIFYEEIYYWALHGEIEELFNDTEKYIDLLEDTIFTPEELPRLMKMIADAKKRIVDNPEKWDEFLATELDPDTKDVFVTVNKADFISFLDHFESMIKEAQETGKNVVFKSDNPLSSGMEIHII
ncbi:MAG: hypothetical protein GX776_05805 [Oxalobacter sp.]|nr:hypothetical protein [Oxalobacter sp.]